MGSYYCHDCGINLTTKGMMYHSADHSISNKNGQIMSFKQKRDKLFHSSSKNRKQRQIEWKKGKRKGQHRELVPKNKWSYYYNRGWRAGKKFMRNNYPYRYFYKGGNSNTQNRNARASNIRRAKNEYRKSKRKKAYKRGSHDNQTYYNELSEFHRTTHR